MQPSMPMPADQAIGSCLPSAGAASRRIRATVLQALARRAQAAGEGALRQQLDARREAWLAGDAAALPPAAVEAEPDEDAVQPASLAGLLDELAAARPAGNKEAYPELPALEHFRRCWDALHARRQLERTLAPAPADAGPLNSAVLARRAIALMQSASPDYLRHFIDYADTLAWLESLREDGVLPASADAPRSSSGTKPAARRASRRR
jgi:hypothetical protein